jgi:hypothetical protein
MAKGVLANAWPKYYHRSMPLNLIYPAVLTQFGRHYVTGAPESRALLSWFLENYYRLEDLEIQDSVCDGHGDKGIDGIYINHQLRQIDYFQVTLVKPQDKTLGDGKLKQFAGSIGQFSTAVRAKAALLVANDELKAIAERVELVKCIEAQYEQRGIFVTNAESDASATTYLAHQTQIILYDRARLQHEFVTIDKTDPIQTPISFDVSNVPSLHFPIGTKLDMVIAPIAASELVKMEGISNGDLFAWNVRQWLGRKTTVNKAVAQSIRTPEEHKFFPAFHNGVTVLCKSLKSTKDRIEIAGYAVVNGCQSITSLYENKASISSDLKILTKFIQVEPDSELATKITDHTNNQNATSARDLQSNNPTQTRLQSQIHQIYPEFHYRIKRGEHPEWPKGSVIENEQLARIILAFDLDKPEAWSQNYKLFDDLHAEIFARPELDAHRAIFVYDAYIATLEKLNLFEDKVFASYTLTRWLVLHLVREALIRDPLGKKCFENPKVFIEQQNGRVRLKACIGQIAQIIVRLLNAEYIRLTKSGYFDYKKELKSKEFILKIGAAIVPGYQIAVDSKLCPSFADDWAKSEKN